jgi:serine/threonine protein kinase
MSVGIPTPGTVLGGKYRIEQVLGYGGIAVVAAAYHLQLHRRVAIKYLLVEALESPEIVERFTREARAAARIRGEHVARVIDVGTFDEGAPYIVLEYLEGFDLERHLKREGPLHITHAVRWILQTCEALAEAHAAKIVHRDLKPANLFLAKGPDHRKKIKVLDFGVSKIIDEPMTERDRILGTVVYMSPEQLRAASEVDLRTDIWSLGVILYELLAGTPPFSGHTIISVAQAIERNAPRPLSEVRPDIPRTLENVVTRCLQTDPNDRYASVLELANALAPFMSTRDRETIRRISGVLQGSIAPQAFDSDNVAAPVLPPAPRVPQMPPPVASDAPMTTSTETANHVVVSMPHARHSRTSTAVSALRRYAVWLVAAVLTVVALLLAVIAIEQRLPGTIAAAPPSEITLRITASEPDAQVRIDDGPPLALPLEKTVPRDDRRHTVRVESPGHEPWATTVSFSSDLHIAMPRRP